MSCGLTISISTQLLAFGIRTESQGFANPKTSPRPSWITPFEPGRFSSHDFLLLRVLLDFLQRGTKLKARGIETVILACSDVADVCRRHEKARNRSWLPSDVPHRCGCGVGQAALNDVTGMPGQASLRKPYFCGGPWLNGSRNICDSGPGFCDRGFSASYRYHALAG